MEVSDRDEPIRPEAREIVEEPVPEGKPLLCMEEGDSGIWQYGKHGEAGALRLLSVEKLLSGDDTCSIELYEWGKESLEKRWARSHKPGECTPGMLCYAAISHTWGQSKDVLERSKNANRPLLIETGKKDEKGGTVPHEISWLGLVQAATAAKRLKCEYLWLDLLCLNQLSEEDKKAQIGNMHNVYRNAMVVVVMFGGVSAAQGLDGTTAWINRAWTLQEATLCEDVWGLLDWKEPIEQCSLTRHGTEFEKLEGNIAIVDVRSLLLNEPGKALGEGRALIGEGRGYMARKSGDSFSLDKPLYCLGEDAAATAALRSAMEASMSKDGEPQYGDDEHVDSDNFDRNGPRRNGPKRDTAVRYCAAWRSMWLRTSTKRADMVFSTMHLLGAEIEVDYSRKVEDLLFELVEKTSSTPAWLAIGYDIPVMPNSGLIPQLPDFQTQIEPTYKIPTKVKPVPASSFVCGDFDCYNFDIRIKTTHVVTGHLVCARIFNVKHASKAVRWRRDRQFDYESEVQLSSPGLQLLTRCWFKGRLDSIDSHGDSLVVIVGRRDWSDVSNDYYHRPFIYLLGRDKRGVWQKTGGGVLEEPLCAEPDDWKSMQRRHLQVGGHPGARVRPCDCVKEKRIQSEDVGKEYELQIYGILGRQSVQEVQRLVDSGADINVSYSGGGMPLLTEACAIDTDRIAELLIQRGANVHAQTPGALYENAMQAACIHGKHRIVRMLVERGVSVNPGPEQEMGTTPLQAAVKNDFGSGDQEATVRLLLDAGADVNAEGGAGRGTALAVAARFGHEAIVKTLLECGADVNGDGGEHGSALMAAIHHLTATRLHGSLDTIRVLIAHGANANFLGGVYGSPLMSAVATGFTELVRMLLDSGADINAVGFSDIEDKMRPGDLGGVKRFLVGALQMACKEGGAVMVQLLLEKGAHVNAKGGSYGTPLGVAAHWGHVEIVRLLLENGADVNIRGGNFHTALQAAAPCCHGDWNGNEDAMFALMEAGADVNAQGGEYGNALQACAVDRATRGKERVIRELINRGADVNAHGGIYGTPLQAAASQGHGNVVRLLMAFGADDKVHPDYEEDFARALHKEGHVGRILELIDKGRNLNVTGGRYWTPLQAASCNDFIGLLDLLGKRRIKDSLRRRPPSPVEQRGIVIQLLKNGADVNVQGGLYGNALQAAAYSGNEGVIQTLLEARAFVNARGGYYGNALQAAACFGHDLAVKRLITAGADLNAQGGRYGTALEAAARHGHLTTIQQLVDAGASVKHATDPYGRPAESLYGHPMPAAAIYGIDPILLLLQYNSSVNGLDMHGRNALHIAAARADFDLLHSLPTLGIDIFRRDYQGLNVLHHAASSGNIDAVERALALGLPKNDPDDEGWTALHWAARKGNKSVIRRLIQVGVDPTASSTDGWTASALAIFHKHLSVASILAAPPRWTIGKGRKSQNPKDQPLDIGAGIELALGGIPGFASKEQRRWGVIVGFQHRGKFCGGCQFEIFGSRYSCKQCDDINSCMRCVDWLSEMHNIGHPGHEFHKCKEGGWADLGGSRFDQYRQESIPEMSSLSLEPSSAESKTMGSKRVEGKRRKKGKSRR